MWNFKLWTLGWTWPAIAADRIDRPAALLPLSLSWSESEAAVPLPALRSAQLSTSPAAKISKPAAAEVQKTQQQQASTQAPSTKQSKSKPVAAQRQAAWLGLGRFWLLASGFYLAGRRQNF